MAEPNEFRPGQTVITSGVYLVTHDIAHAFPHEVTCVAGRRFPPCDGCGHPRFKLVHPAQHIEAHPMFHRQGALTAQLSHPTP